MTTLRVPLSTFALLLAAPASAQFGPEQVVDTVALPGFTASVHAADIDGDGDVDLASAYYGAAGLDWYENDGMGAFGSAQSIDATLEFSRQVRAVDIDGDGDRDLVAGSDGDDSIVVYENLGGEVFGPRRVLDSRLDNVTALEVADLDDDGDLDIVAAYFCIDAVVYIESLGGGNFAPAIDMFPATAVVINEAELADIDGDGDSDLVMAVRSFQGDLAIMTNLGGGAFAAPVFYDVATTNELYDVTPADVDRDGDLDLMIARASGSRGYAWLENEGGDFAQSHSIDTGVNAWGIEAVDVDRDGDLDALAVDESNDGVYLYENLGDAFSPRMLIDDYAGNVWMVAPADFDGDDQVDFAVPVASGGARLSWYANEFPQFEVYCDPALPSAAAIPARLFAEGSDALATNDVELQATSLPPSSVTVFLASRTRGFFPGARGSDGILCLGGTIGRFLSLGRVDLADANGSVSLPIDAMSLPVRGGVAAALPGETWNFQGWFRDSAGAPGTSNFTNGMSVTFR